MRETIQNANGKQFHAVSLSGGKDSTAMLLLMIERDMPINMVLSADTGMEFLEMYEHLAKLDEHLFRERGIHITTLRHPKGFEYLMFDEPKQKPRSLENRATAGHKFSIGCAKDGELVGVAIVGRPVSRYLDDGWTLEVNRLCTTGEKNACSILYAASARAAKAMGYRKIITYTLDSESGSSLRAAGWSCAGMAGGKCWTGSRKPASALYPAQMKLRYEKLL